MLGVYVCIVYIIYVALIRMNNDILIFLSKAVKCYRQSAISILQLCSVFTHRFTRGVYCIYINYSVSNAYGLYNTHIYMQVYFVRLLLLLLLCLFWFLLCVCVCVLSRLRIVLHNINRYTVRCSCVPNSLNNKCRNIKLAVVFFLPISAAEG